MIAFACLWLPSTILSAAPALAAGDQPAAPLPGAATAPSPSATANTQAATALVTIGDTTITEQQYEQALAANKSTDASDQGRTMRKLVCDVLVDLEAQADGVAPTNVDVAARLALLNRTSPQSVPDSDADPKAYDGFLDGLKYDIALENVRMHDVTVTDSEVRTYYNRHRASYSLPLQIEVSMIVTHTHTDAARAATYLKAGLSEDAIAGKPRMNVIGVRGYTYDLNLLPDHVRQAIQRMMTDAQVGDVRTLPASSDFYLTVDVTKRQPEEDPSLARVYDRVKRDARLGKAPDAATEIGILYRRCKPVFSKPRYEKYFQDLEPSPGGQASTVWGGAAPTRITHPIQPLLTSDK